MRILLAVAGIAGLLGARAAAARAETAFGVAAIERLADNPAHVLMGRSPFASARGLRAFLADARRIDAYMNSALTRAVLNSSFLAKAVLARPAVVRAFLASPALADPAVVRELVGSPMLHKILDCPAIQEALGDPAVVASVSGDPQTAAWLAARPEALMVLAKSAPALGGALGVKSL